MPRNKIKAVPEGNGLVPQQEESGPYQSTQAGIYRVFKERLDAQLNVMKHDLDPQHKMLDKRMEKTRERRQRSAGLEQEARQPRLATEADALTYT